MLPAVIRWEHYWSNSLICWVGFECVGWVYYLILNTPSQTDGRDNRKFVTQVAEAIGGEAFGEEVGNLIKCGKVAELDVFVENFFPNEMNVDFDVLSASMGYGICC